MTLWKGLHQSLTNNRVTVKWKVEANDRKQFTTYSTFWAQSELRIYDIKTEKNLLASNVVNASCAAEA